ncbi:MAG: hypothetical protein JEZ06_08530 [Anaerolineaceae bacterium]|nr:hypothetical protein [Anaerolineaceae bacterium]
MTKNEEYNSEDLERSSSEQENTQPITQKGDGNLQSDETRRVNLSVSNSQETLPLKALRAEQAQEPSFDELSGSDDEVKTEPGDEIEKGSKKKNKKKRKFPRILVGILIIIVGTALGVWFGYQSGLQDRINAENQMISLTATTQFQLGLQAIDDGQLEIARKHFEYVIQVDPTFPGAAEKLTEVMLFMAETAVPTAAPTATSIPMTPTPDTRTEEEIFGYINSLVRNHAWDEAILSIEMLRKTNLTYRAVEVDGMYYTALRNRGVDKILNGLLEAGMYDLALAERFGPLDRDAESYRNWARYYTTGASFWEIDWAQVVEYFSQIAPSMPNLRDGSGWTAQERLRIGYMRYGDQFWAAEQWCSARDQYRLSLSLLGDPALAPTATHAQWICEPPTPTPTITPVFTNTPEIVDTPVPAPTEDPLIAVCCEDRGDGNYNPADENCAAFTCP